MNTIIIILTVVVSLIGLVLSIQTLIDTRNKNYHEFVVRKDNRKTGNLNPKE